MPYFLVVLKAVPASDEEAQHADAHVAFIDSLIERRLVFLGGDFSEPVDGITAAYLLRCGSIEEAEAIAADDPYAIHDVCEAEAVEWQLVGIDPQLIDSKLVD
ncbi:MAG: YciI family protein [Gaiellaceae bacterium]